MSHVEFMDPFAAKARASDTASASLAPVVPAAPGTSMVPLQNPAGPSRGRDHELRRLIRDLEALASRNKPSWD